MGIFVLSIILIDPIGAEIFSPISNGIPSAPICGITLRNGEYFLLENCVFIGILTTFTAFFTFWHIVGPPFLFLNILVSERHGPSLLLFLKPS